MYSLQGDTVLDPFLGTGTTSIASITSKRNSIGFEIDPMFLDIIIENIENISINFLNSYVQNRIEQHREFIIERNADPKKDEIEPL